MGELQSDFCKNLTEFYQISLKNVPHLTAFSPQLAYGIYTPHRGSIRNLTLIGPMVSEEERVFKVCGGQWQTPTYTIAFGSGELTKYSPQFCLGISKIILKALQCTYQPFQPEGVWQSYLMMGINVKILKIQTPEKSAIVTLKFQQGGFIIE